MNSVKVQELDVFALFSLFLKKSTPSQELHLRQGLGQRNRWFLLNGKLENMANPRNGMMYHIKKVSSTSSTTMGKVQGTILPLSCIRQSCMLFPIFPSSIPAHWMPNSILDHASVITLPNHVCYVMFALRWTYDLVVIDLTTACRLYSNHTKILFLVLFCSCLNTVSEV